MENFKVTIFNNILDTRNPLHVDVVEVFKRIKEGESKELIESIRNEKVEKNQQLYKRRLPSICFSGVFSERKSGYLLQHSGLICLDIDHVKEKDMPLIREAITRDSFTYACFVSPRGSGFKVVVKITDNPDTHKGQFLSLEQHFNKVIQPYEIDKSGKDVTRVCYESFDPGIYYNEESDVYDSILKEEIKPVKTTDAQQILEGLRKWIDKKESYSQGNRNNYLTTFAHALCRYGVEKTTVGYYFATEYPDYPAKEVEAMLRSIYNGNDFGSETFTVGEFSKSIENIGKTQKANNITLFWHINDKGRVKIDTKKYLEFVEANGFGIYRPKESLKNWIFVKVTNKIVDEVDVVDIKKVVLDYIEKHANAIVFDELQMKNRFFESSFLNALSEINVEQIKDLDNESYMFFTDFYYVITRKQITKKTYPSLQGKHIWRNQVCKKNMTERVNFEKHPFNQFVFRALTGGKESNKDKYFAACSALGYSIHTYKKQRLTKLIYSCDESFGEIDGNAEGGTGKNLFQKCLKYVRSVVEIDGKDFDKRDKFKFQTINPDTQIVMLDDYEGDIKELFSKITGNFEIEKKGISKVSIEFEDAPKLLVSSNSTPKGYSNSYQRRLHMMEFTNYYNSKTTPSSEFGDRDFFSDDWNQNDWNALYSFLIWCVQLYLNKGLISAKSENMKGKMLVKNTSVYFAEYFTKLTEWNLYETNNGRQFYDDFIKSKEDDNDTYSPQLFYTLCRKMCEIYGWNFKKEGKGERTYITFENFNGFDNK